MSKIEIKEILKLTDVDLRDRIKQHINGHVKINRAKTKPMVWFIWTGKVWQEFPAIPDEYYYKAIQELVEHAQNFGQDAIKYFAAAKKLAATYGRNAVESMMRHDIELYMNPNEFDAHHAMLNCKSGMIDLSSGTEYSHDHEYYMTKQVSVNYNPNATCPLWTKFLDEVTQGDKELQEYLQMAVGYSATGYTSEQVLFYIIGERGMNGKSLFLTTIQKVLGDYAASARSNIFTSKNDGSIEHSLAGLYGSRFVTLIETGNEHINEVILKRITGEDILPARYLYQEGFSFSPTWKIWVASNEMLSLKEAGDATFRRIRVIPFNADFYGSADNQLSEKFKAEYEGILRWIVDGAVKWFKNGKQLFVPDSVELETIKYRDNQDGRHLFLHKCTESDPNGEVGLETMYEEYVKYCRVINVVPSSKISLGKIIYGDRHADKGHTKQGERCWKGIRLLTDKERKQKLRINTNVGKFLTGKRMNNE